MKKAFLALATAMCLPAMAVNASNITPYVVGGDPVTDISTQSWMASLRIVSMDNAHNCGASVIADNWLVTAAHCVVTPGSNGKYMVIPPQHLNVAVGSATIDLSDVAHLYSVSHVVVHPDYMPDGDFEQDYNGDIIVNKTGLYSDIALLRVHRSFPADSVTPITLASPEIATEIDTRLAAEWDAANRVKNTSVSGWGAVDPGASEAPNTLQQAELTFLPIADCFQLIEQGNSIHGSLKAHLISRRSVLSRLKFVMILRSLSRIRNWMKTATRLSKIRFIPEIMVPIRVKVTVAVHCVHKMQMVTGCRSVLSAVG
ncbi:secreted trypsin-like serine protease [Photobacterium aphoticum]|uniref:Secreted trypsin-like serine protease n=1 Tax=Photobacterium aphoticum TaxID=754436 RepID=A0A090QJG6_9GAMM|nr:secreted trypsin-like serine protease [Photobacterium aphoticum]